MSTTFNQEIVGQFGKEIYFMEKVLKWEKENEWYPHLLDHGGAEKIVQHAICTLNRPKVQY